MPAGVYASVRVNRTDHEELELEQRAPKGAAHRDEKQGEPRRPEPLEAVSLGEVATIDAIVST